jgi:hypothetical protein
MILAEGVALASFKHKGLSGIEREEPVRRFLRFHLPGRFFVGQGSIASSECILEHQHDIIVADRDASFTLLNTLNAQLFAIESCHLIVEVRSRDNEIDSLGASFRAVRNLKSQEGLRQLGSAHGSDQGTTAPPVQTVVLYQGPVRPNTLLKKLVAVNATRAKSTNRLAIDYMLVLSSTKDHTPDGGYLIGYSRTDANGRKFAHHYYPWHDDQELEGPRVIAEGSESFGQWYAAVLHHLSGVIAYPPILYSYLGNTVTFVPWDRKPF